MGNFLKKLLRKKKELVNEADDFFVVLFASIFEGDDPLIIMINKDEALKKIKERMVKIEEPDYECLSKKIFERNFIMSKDGSEHTAQIKIINLAEESEGEYLSKHEEREMFEILLKLFKKKKSNEEIKKEEVLTT